VDSQCSCSSSLLVTFEKDIPEPQASSTFLPKFRKKAALDMWMRVLWLARQRFYVVGSWGIYTGPVKEQTRDTDFRFQEEGNWQNTAIRSNSYITACATEKIPHKPHVQEIFCNEKGQITQHLVSPHHRLWNTPLTLGQRMSNQYVLYHVVASDVSWFRLGQSQLSSQ